MFVPRKAKRKPFQLEANTVLMVKGGPRRGGIVDCSPSVTIAPPLGLQSLADPVALETGPRAILRRTDHR